MIIPLLAAALLAPPRPHARTRRMPPAAAPRPAPAMRFSPAALDLAPGETYPVELFVPSPTGHQADVDLSLQGWTGVTVQPDHWSGSVPPWGIKLYPKVSLAAAADPNASGEVTATTHAGGHDAAAGRLGIHVAQPVVSLISGLRELTIRVHNPFQSRAFDGRVQVANSDRFLQDVDSRTLHVLPGQDETVTIPLPGASPAPGARYLFTGTVQSWQGYSHAFSQRLSFPQRVGY